MTLHASNSTDHMKQLDCDDMNPQLAKKLIGSGPCFDNKGLGILTTMIFSLATRQKPLPKPMLTDLCQCHSAMNLYGNFILHLSNLIIKKIYLYMIHYICAVMLGVDE